MNSLAFLTEPEQPEKTSSRPPFSDLASPVFLISLAILILNDSVLKQTYHNWLTGKLSDFSGLVVFSMFWSAVFPNRRRLVFVLTGLLFTFWKSSLSQSLIDFWNSLALPKIGRTVDYSDLFAFAVLPFAYSTNFQSEIFPRRRLATTAIAVIAMCSILGSTCSHHRPSELPRARFVANPAVEYLFGLDPEDVDEALRARFRVWTSIRLPSDPYTENRPSILESRDELSKTPGSDPLTRIYFGETVSEKESLEARVAIIRKGRCTLLLLTEVTARYPGLHRNDDLRALFESQVIHRLKEPSRECIILTH